MIIYFLLAMLPLVLKLAIPNIDADQRQRKKYIIICSVVLIAIVGCRSKYVGSTDTFRYTTIMQSAFSYQSLSSYLDYNLSEKGFAAFVWLISRFFKNTQWIIAISSAFYITCFARMAYKYSCSLANTMSLYVTIGILTFQMQGMRQAIAMGICLLAYDHAINRKIVKFLFTVLIAMMFHQTAIVFLVVYPLFGMKYSLRNVALVLFTTIAALALSSRILSFANSFFDRNYTEVSSAGGVVRTAVYVLICIISGWFIKDMEFDKTKSGLYYLLILTVGSFVSRYFAAHAIERLSYYYLFAHTLVLPSFESRFTESSKKIFGLLLCGFFTVYFLYELSGGNSLVPFKFFWQQ